MIIPDTAQLTPLMRQYFDIKKEFPDALLLFQVGDFYELFFEDAHKAAAFLGIVLTQRGTLGDQPIPLCGVPRHTVDHYLVKLVKGGFCVVICDQLEPAQHGKVVDRGVTQIYTPGTLTDAKLIDSKSPHYLAATALVEGVGGCLVYEMRTGQLFMTQFAYSEQKLDAELGAFMPRETVVAETNTGAQLAQVLQARNCLVTVQQMPFTPPDAFGAWYNSLELSHQSRSLEQTLLVLYTYLAKNAPTTLTMQPQVRVYDAQEFLQLDAATQRNLELIINAYDGTSQNSIFSCIDDAVTAMGSRKIKKWLIWPLRDQPLIEQRLDQVQQYVHNTLVREKIRDTLKKIGDLERTIGRMILKRAQHADYVALCNSLKELPACAPYLNLPMPPYQAVFSLLSRALNVDSTVAWKITSGYHDELDRLRSLSQQGMHLIFALEQKEQQLTGINTLKIRYSNAAGYAIELSKAYADAIPARYMKSHSLTTRDRYTTQELKDLEYDLSRAESASLELEQQIYHQFTLAVAQYLPDLKRLSESLSDLDVFTSFAHTAVTQRFVRPQFGDTLTITGGRHPIVEQRMRARRLNSSFIPNDTALSRELSTWIITGPNMGGKSTYLRQVAVISLLAHIGSFVPAQAATIPLLDRIFTRIGSGDSLAEGKSTFLVEMEEAANICQYATPQSLVILDEIGRGTSTYDGMALAQAILEFLHDVRKPLCLFATHYHELTVLAERPGIACYHAATLRRGDEIILTHKILPGAAEGSFGLQVAQSAHLPAQIITRARELLAELPNAPVNYQVSLAPAVRAPDCLQKITSIDLDTISPRQAYDILAQLQKELV